MRQLDTAARALMTNVEARYGDSSAGAARALNVEPVRGDVSDFLDANFQHAYERGAFAGLRWDITGRLKASENPLVKALGNVLGEETVGNANRAASTFRAITEDQAMIQRRFELDWSREYWSAWRDYRERNGLGWAASMNGEETAFRQLITAFVRNQDPTREFDPAAVRMGQRRRTPLRVCPRSFRFPTEPSQHQPD